MLEGFCIVCLSKQPLTQRVIGIASEPVYSQRFSERGFSEDIFFQEFKENDKLEILSMAEAYTQLLKEFGFVLDDLFNEKTICEEEYEYPVMQPSIHNKASPAARLIERARIRNLGKLKKKSKDP